MKPHFCISFLTAPLLIFYACNDTNEIESKLHKADVYMTEHPELALEVLESIDPKDLTTREVQAEHALLYSMALDKNYIDLTNDSIIAPAIKYYKTHGSADDKLKSYYYGARIYHNAGDTEKAMRYYIAAEEYADKAKDSRTIARLYANKAYIYMNLYETQKALRDLNNATHYATKSADTSIFINVLLDKANCHNILNNTDSSQNILLSLEGVYFNKMSVVQKSRWYGIYTSSYSTQDEVKVMDLLSSYIKEIPDKFVYWLNVAKLYLDIDLCEQASTALSKYEQMPNFTVTASYLYIKARIKFQLQEFEEASLLYDRYIEQYGKDDLNIIKDETKFVETRYFAEQQHKNDLYVKIILVLSMLIITFVLVFIIYKIRNAYLYKQEEKMLTEARNIELEKQVREYNICYNNVCEELAELKCIKSNTTLNKDVIKHIDDRMKVLNKFIIAEITGNYSEAASVELKKLMASQNDFIESTKWAFALSHPKFIDYLKQLGMNDWEIGCCCLYAIGLRGKNIFHYLNMSEHEFYKISGKLRHKLKLNEYKVNIDKHLIELLHNLSE